MGSDLLWKEDDERISNAIKIGKENLNKRNNKKKFRCLIGFHFFKAVTIYKLVCRECGETQDYNPF